MAPSASRDVGHRFVCPAVCLVEQMLYEVNVYQWRITRDGEDDATVWRTFNGAIYVFQRGSAGTSIVCSVHGQPRLGV